MSQYKIFEIEGTGRTWVHDMLEENEIPYEAKVEAYWTGLQITRFHEHLAIYVDEQYIDRAEQLIKEYKEKTEFIEESPEMEIGEDGLPQVTCPECNTEYDFDYPKCPNCGRETKL